MRRRVVLAVLGSLLVVGGLAAYVVYESHHPRGWKLTAAERSDIRDGGWKRALQPIDTIPVASDAAAEEVAARLAAEYCSERETQRVEQHTTDHDYVKYVPGCFEIEQPEDRLAQHSALMTVEAQEGGPPMLVFAWNGKSCMVNTGDQYEDHGICVRDLLDRALEKSGDDY